MINLNVAPVYKCHGSENLQFRLIYGKYFQYITFKWYLYHIAMNRKDWEDVLWKWNDIYNY